MHMMHNRTHCSTPCTCMTSHTTSLSYLINSIHCTSIIKWRATKLTKQKINLLNCDFPATLCDTKQK